MEPEDFAAWMAHMGFNIQTAAERLDLGRNTVARYRRKGAPGHIGLACSAIAMGIPAWKSRSPS